MENTGGNMRSILILMLCIGCTMNLEETFIEGSDNKVQEDSRAQADPNVKANVQIPMKAI